MIISKELYRNDENYYDLGSRELNLEYGLDDSKINGTPNHIAIENFAAVNYFNSLLSNYIFAFHYTKKGFVSSYYKKGKFNNTFVIAEDDLTIREYFSNELRGLLGEKLISILKDENISLFQAAMIINYHISDKVSYIKNITIQQEIFDSVNQENCKYNHMLMEMAGINDMDNLLNSHIGPTYLKYRGYTREFDKNDANGKIFLEQNADILNQEDTIREYLDVCGNEQTMRVVLNAMSTDCSADMVAWGYKIISGINRDNINYEDINQAYRDYQNYFLPKSNQIGLSK